MSSMKREAGDVHTLALALGGDAGEGHEVGWLEGVIVAGGHGGNLRGLCDGIGGKEDGEAMLMAGRRVMVVTVLGLGHTGCVGQAPALPEVMGSGNSTGVETAPAETSGEDTDSDMSTSDPMGSTTDVGGASTSASTGAGSETSTGPTSECGNGDVEDGEECDGTDWNGATCESLGHFPGALGCGEGCLFDVSGCVPPGMVLVPGGEFTMGSEVSSDEQPIRTVQVDSFYIDETEVTVAAYDLCVSAGVCSEPNTGGNCNWMVAGRENHPLNCVDWYQATQYCGWVSGGTKRLPTEAEWEKAARGTDARVYPWGDEPEPSCSHVVMYEGSGGCENDSTMEVGSKPLGNSPFGAQDMSGNVHEWVSDWYANSYDPGETNNPTGPAKGSSRVLRGGSWNNGTTNNFRAADRDGSAPTSSVTFVGMRCARTPPEAP